ncbi:MAG TPA: hypothetical protein VH107_20890 [Lacipirellulaceae bacterium]|nr:hypothetical protein [Lacipirellulaceae bacterium]
MSPFLAAQQSTPAPVIDFPAKVIPNGVYNYDRTVIIPRQRGNINVPAPYGGKSASRPGGILRGEDRYGTVLRFNPTVTGQLIKTELYGEGKAGNAWNDGNSAGDRTLQASLCSSATDLTIDGRAEIRAYPWSYPEWAPKPDPHGPDLPYRADGLCIEGSGFIGKNLRFFQIPGTAIILKSGRNGSAGASGIYDAGFNQLEDIYISNAIYGINVAAADSKLSHIYITGIIKDGLTISGSGTVVEEDHVWGADRSAVFTEPASARECYHEAARIGTYIASTAYGTRIDGLNIGPGTCWERGVKIDAHGCSITGLFGTVASESKEHPDIAGVEVAANLLHEVITGSLVVASDPKNPATTAKGLILRGNRQKVDLKGGWNSPCKATFIRVEGAVTGSTVEVRGTGDGGTVLDLSASELNKVEGGGNEFKIKWGGTSTRVIYPGGGNHYNLAPGTQLWIDGQLQSAATIPRKRP